jgi:hypothetical protein
MIKVLDVVMQNAAVLHEINNRVEHLKNLQHIADNRMVQWFETIDRKIDKLTKLLEPSD